MDKPFIYLFTSPNRKYFFDVNKNQIVTIQDDLYMMLHQWTVEGQDPSIEQLSGSTYKQLVNKGFLSSNKVKEIEHPMSPYLKTYLERDLRVMVLQVTQACNFRCKYCNYTSGAEGVQRKHTKATMTWEVAQMAVEYWAEHSSDTAAPSISFYGGEPLLEFDLVKKVVEYAEDRLAGRPVLFSTTVNGSLLTPEICQFLQEHNFSLLVSLDGTKDDHNKNRVFASSGGGTFDVVIRKLRMIVNQFPKLAKNTNINMVVDNQAKDVVFNLSQLDSEVFGTVGGRCTFVDTTYNESSTQADDTMLAKRYTLQDALAILAILGKDFSDDIAFISKEHIRRRMVEIAQMTPQRGFATKGAPSGPCVPGAARLFVTYEGKLFPCERVSETSKEICLGDIKTGVSFEKAYEFLNVAQESSEKCKGCFAFRHCNLCGRVCSGTKEYSQSLRDDACQKARANCAFLLRMNVLMQEAQELYGKTLEW